LHQQWPTKEKIMKPISPTAHNSPSFPLVEFNYQPMSLSRYHAGCGKSVPPAFHSISSTYFQGEARRDFVGELCLFVAIVVTTAAPLFSAASAITEFCRAIGQF
jgi:hypothetical protein